MWSLYCDPWDSYIFLGEYSTAYNQFVAGTQILKSLTLCVPSLFWRMLLWSWIQDVPILSVLLWKTPVQLHMYEAFFPSWPDYNNNFPEATVFCPAWASFIQRIASCITSFSRLIDWSSHIVGTFHVHISFVDLVFRKSIVLVTLEECQFSHWRVLIILHEDLLTLRAEFKW